jgi:NNP family nitrate/nitrite transporter-like MFS transporter
MKEKRLEIVCACAAAFAFSSNYTNHAPLAPLLMKQFAFTQAMAGLLTTGIFLTHATMQIPGGYLADRFGGRRVLAWALAIVCAGNVGIAYAGSYGELLFWKVFAGFGTGTCFVAGARYLAQSVPSNLLARAQGYYGGSVLLGSGFVIYAVPRAAEAVGWSGAFLTTALVAVAVLVFWLALAPAPQSTAHAPVSLLSLLGHEQLWLLGSVQMASFGLVIVIGTWITQLLRMQAGMSAAAAGGLGSLVLLIGIASRPLGGVLARDLPVRPLVAASLAINVVGCLTLAWAGSSVGWMVGGIVLLGIGCGLPYATLFNRAASLFPGRAGAAMGLVNMLGIVMILVGAPVVGKIADWTGSFHAAFASLAAFSAAALLAALFIRE